MPLKITLMSNGLGTDFIVKEVLTHLGLDAPSLQPPSLPPCIYLKESNPQENVIEI
jgi:hypothetical protein